MQLIIRQSGNLIDISPDGQSPTPQPIIDLLRPHLTYSYRRVLFGAEQYDATDGTRRRAIDETRILFRLEEGRIVTGAGFIQRIVRVLAGAGHIARYQDLSPPRRRPRCYEIDWSAVTSIFQYRPRQEECLRQLLTTPGGIVHAVTGFGKSTLIGMVAVALPYAKIHVIVKSVDIAERLVRNLTAHVPNVGQIGNGKNREGRVTVITGDSLHKSDGDCDIMLGDEVHKLAADSYANPIAALYRYSRNFGFSATPYARADGASARLESMFGPTVFELLYPEAVELGLVAPIMVDWLHVRMSNNINPAANKSGVPRKRWGIWRNQERNQIIATDARTFPDDQQTLILVETIEHAVHLGQFLPEYTLVYGGMKPQDRQGYIKQGLLPQSFPEMTPQRRILLRTDFELNRLKKVIATDVWSEGVDFQQLGVMYRADDRDSEILDSQGPGRVSRIFDGKSYGLVKDCIDYFDQSCHNKSRSRYRSYDALGWEQNWPNTSRKQMNRSRRETSHG